MKNILIVTPHFPPSNLAAVHRSRLFAQHLPKFGWNPIILCVHEDYYEEKLDHNLTKLLPKSLRIEKVKAFKVTKPRIVGDIGLRGFWQLYKKAKKIISTEDIHFLLIPIPSYYGALLGRLLHQSTGVKYGIDYIDPWVHFFTGSNRVFSRHWMSTKLAKFLEPIAVKNASLISGVAEGYYKGVLERNPSLKNRCAIGAMPYGGEILDYQIVADLNIHPYVFEKKPNRLQFVYAGAMLPNAYAPLESIFRAISQDLDSVNDVEFHFIGTGKHPNDPLGFNIKPLAEKYNIWNSIVFEYPQRIPYMDVLVHLDNADAVFILGSTEPHYTPSKVYQGVLSGKPVFAILHSQSTAVPIIRNSNAGVVLDFNGMDDISKIEGDFITYLNEFREFAKSFRKENVDDAEFKKYSAAEVTGILANLLNKAV